MSLNYVFIPFSLISIINYLYASGQAKRPRKKNMAESVQVTTHATTFTNDLFFPYIYSEKEKSELCKCDKTFYDDCEAGNEIFDGKEKSKFMKRQVATVAASLWRVRIFETELAGFFNCHM